MIKINEMLYARMIRLLIDGATSHSIAVETGLHRVTTQSYLRALHKEKAIHVIAWVKNSRGVDTTAVFKLGLGEDKPRSKMTRAEIAKRYRYKRSLRRRVEWMKSKVEQLQQGAL